MKISRLKKDVFFFICGTLFILFCWIILYATISNAYLMPSPFNVIGNAFSLLFDLNFYQYFFPTLLRVVFSVLISLILGLIFAILSYVFKGVYLFLNPIIAFLRSLPTLSILLLLLVFLPRIITPIVVCVLAVFPIIYTSIYNSLSNIDYKTLEMLKVYNVKVKKQIIPVYFKGSLPTIIKEIFTSLSFSLKLVVSSEILANVYKSVGGELQTAYLYSNMVLLMALTLLVCLLGLIFEFVGSLLYFKIGGKSL